MHNLSTLPFISEKLHKYTILLLLTEQHNLFFHPRTRVAGEWYERSVSDSHTLSALTVSFGWAWQAHQFYGGAAASPRTHIKKRQILAHACRLLNRAEVPALVITQWHGNIKKQEASASPSLTTCQH